MHGTFYTEDLGWRIAFCSLWLGWEDSIVMDLQAISFGLLMRFGWLRILL